MPATLEVITPAARRSLTTASRFRYASPSEIEMDDEALERLISSTTGIIEGLLGRTLALERVRETELQDGPLVVLISRTPVITVHAVTIDAVATTAWSLTSPQAGMVRFDRTYRHDEWMWRMLGGPRLYDSYPMLQPYSIEYTGGYEMPDDDSTGTLPAELEHACHLLLRGQLDLGKRGALGITAERLGDASRAYAGGSSSVPGMAEVMPIISRYRRVPL